MATLVTDEDIARHEKLVRTTAAALCRGDRELFLDLCQEGRIAIFLHLPEYSPARATEERFLLPHVEGAMLHYLRDHARLIRLPCWVHERGEFPDPPLSLETASDEVDDDEDDDSEHGHPDRSQDTARAALACVDAGRLVRRARLSSRQLAAFRRRQLTALPLSHAQTINAGLAARKLRRAAVET